MQIVLQNWEILSIRNDPYKAPEQSRSVLRGQVFGHEDHIDGTTVTTTEIVEASGRWVRTQNHEYQLADPNPEYEAWYSENYGRKLSDENPFPSVNEV